MIRFLVKVKLENPGIYGQIRPILYDTFLSTLKIHVDHKFNHCFL